MCLQQSAKSGGNMCPEGDAFDDDDDLPDDFPGPDETEDDE